MVQAIEELPENTWLPNDTSYEISSLADSFHQMLAALKRAYIGIRTDVLTGLNNRMKLDEILYDEVNRAQRYRHIFSVIMMDIDHFKRVNDTYGHLAGDEVLKKISVLIRKTFRKTDTPGRWGGEEFLVLLPAQDIRCAVQVAERLREYIELSKFGEIGRITASFGVTQYQMYDTPTQLIKRADDAMYEAKNKGRNCVVSSSSS